MPITELTELLRFMEPMQRQGEYVFVGETSLPAGVVIQASVRESEGPSSVILRSDADQLGLHYDFAAAWITLTVHSSLDAVGLTAAVSTALAHENIPCNVIAGLHHDHLLVPVEKAEVALVALHRLTAG